MLKVVPMGRTSEPSVGLAEDTEAYGDRLNAWTGDLGPRNRVELYLVEHAVRLSWQLDRADRAGLLLVSEATRGAWGPALAETATRMDHPGSVGSESGERLRRHQLACSRMLLRTLETLVGLRRALGAAGSEQAIASARLANDPPGGDLVDPVRSGDGAIEEVATTDRVPPGGSPRPIVDGSESPAPLPGPADRLPEAADSADPSGSARPRMRRRVPRRWTRQADRSASSRPGTWGPTSDPKGTTPRRETQPPEAASDRPEARRRVGGYAVPLDPSVPVSIADRIPVRLRRQAAATRLSRAASFPSE